MLNKVGEKWKTWVKVGRRSWSQQLRRGLFLLGRVRRIHLKYPWWHDSSKSVNKTPADSRRDHVVCVQSQSLHRLTVGDKILSNVNSRQIRFNKCMHDFLHLTWINTAAQCWGLLVSRFHWHWKSTLSGGGHCCQLKMGIRLGRTAVGSAPGSLRRFIWIRSRKDAEKTERFQQQHLEEIEV